MSVSKELADAVQKVVQHGIVKLETSGEQRVLVEISKPSPEKFRRPPVILQMHFTEHEGNLLEAKFKDQDFNHPPPAEFHDQQIVEDVFQTIKLGLERLEMVGLETVKLVVAGIEFPSVAVKFPPLNLRYCFEWASEFNAYMRRNRQLKECDGFIIRREERINMLDIDRRLHLNHPNIQVIHEIDVNDDFFYWKVEKFTNTLSDVINGVIPYDEKIFLQLFPALQYLREKKICHGSIHEFNIACIRKKNCLLWFYADVVGMKKKGELQSNVYTRDQCLRRHDEIRNDPNNDVWQTNIMYTIARFGLQTKDFKVNKNSDLGYFLPEKSEVSKILLFSSDGKKLRKLINRKPEDNDINVLRDIIQKENDNSISDFKKPKISDQSSTSFESTKFSITPQNWCYEDGKKIVLIQKSLEDRLNEIFCELKIKKCSVSFLIRGDFKVKLTMQTSIEKLMNVEISKTNQSCVETLGQSIDWSKIKPSLVSELVKLFYENDVGCVEFRIDDNETSFNKYRKGKVLPGSSDKRLYQDDVFRKISRRGTRHDFMKLLELDHPNIETISDIYENKDGEFFFKISKKEKTSEENVSKFKEACLDVLSGLEHLRDENICHGAINLKSVAWNGICFVITDLVRDDDFHIPETSDYFISCIEKKQKKPMFDLLQLAWMVSKSLFNVKENDPQNIALFKRMFSTQIGSVLLGFLEDAPHYLSKNQQPTFYYDKLRNIIESIQPSDFMMRN